VFEKNSFIVEICSELQSSPLFSDLYAPLFFFLLGRFFFSFSFFFVGFFSGVVLGVDHTFFSSVNPGPTHGKVF